MKDNHLQFRHFFHCISWAFLAEAGIFESVVGYQIDALLRFLIDVEVVGFRFAGEFHRSFDVLGENAGRELVHVVIR